VPYYVLLILHAPDFWKWAIGPLFLYILERLYRFLSLFVGHGYSHIVDADVLPSRFVIFNNWSLVSENTHLICLDIMNF
jgi:hypothetical protein